MRLFKSKKTLINEVEMGKSAIRSNFIPIFTDNYLPYGLDDEDVKEELRRLSEIRLSNNTNIRTPLCIQIDLSGSMEKHMSMVKKIIKQMKDELDLVQGRDFTLIIVGIHRGTPILMYFGDLSMFSYSNFMNKFPSECSGLTPLARTYNISDALLCALAETLEKYSHWYTIPVFFSITDAQATDSKDDCLPIIKKFSEQICEGEKLLVEFVTNTNKDGLNMGGYKVRIDDSNAVKNVKIFMSALRGATSTDKKLGENTTYYRPYKEDREEYNQFVSEIMLLNFKYCYERYKSNYTEGE